MRDGWRKKSIRLPARNFEGGHRQEKQSEKRESGIERRSKRETQERDQREKVEGKESSGWDFREKS